MNEELDIHTTPEEGKQYTEGIYVPLEDETLEDAPETADYPDPGRGEPLKLTKFPKAPKLLYILGPSIIMAGGALGSGELVFWPNLSAKHGLGLWWAFWIGVTTQFFINMEIERPTMLTGESVFRSWWRINRWLPSFFFLAVIGTFAWPGWGAGAAKLTTAFVGLDLNNWYWISITYFVLIVFAMAASKVIYKTVEILEKMLLATILPLVIVVIVWVGFVGTGVSSGGVSVTSAFRDLGKGVVNFGWMPENIDMLAFLGALAYAGAGGCANLTQSLWIRDKGFGMATFFGRVAGLAGENEYFPPRGYIAKHDDQTSHRRWRAWWRVANWEHFCTFWVLLIVTTALLCVLAAILVPGNEEGGIDMVISEASVLTTGFSWLIGKVFLLGGMFILLTTQISVMDIFVRSLSDIFYDLIGRKTKFWSLKTSTLVFLAAYSVLAIGIIYTQRKRIDSPWAFLKIAASTSGVVMWIYNMLLTYNNVCRLPKRYQMGWIRLGIMYWAILFFGYFSVLVISDQVARLSYAWASETILDVMGRELTACGVAMWAIYILLFCWIVFRTIRGKLSKG